MDSDAKSLTSKDWTEILTATLSIKHENPQNTYLKKIDEILLKVAVDKSREHKFYFADGVAAFLNYFSRSCQITGQKQFLSKIIEELKWHESFIEYYSDKSDLKIDFTLISGLTGLLLALCHVKEIGIDSSFIDTNILEGSLYIYKNGLEIDTAENQFSFYPTYTNPNKNQVWLENVLNFTQGDLNEVLLFYKVADLFSLEKYYKVAKNIGFFTTTRKTYEQTKIKDSSFSKGAAGLTNYYGSLFKMTKQPQYLVAKLFWAKQTIEFLNKEMAKEYYKSKEFDLMDGLLGVILTLDDLNTSSDPIWTRSLLL
ncbi:MAG: lanthionine synthetase LanC family protein [Emticicia sp.]|uniref:lanthionine synthetase LanC family protein n=1 Tax=Emticicia sp. TaxID=1930953 RepID=UPI003BA7F351